jgi:hypothetical protein
MQQLTAIRRHQEAYRTDFSRIRPLRDFPDLQVPDPAPPPKRRAAHQPNRFKWKSVSILAFERQNDGRNRFQPSYLPVNVKHLRL